MTSSNEAPPPTPLMPAMSSEPAEPRSRRKVSRRQRVLLVVLFLLSCLLILTSTVAVWVHQVALNTDRWVSVVGPVVANPDVQASLSDRIATQVVTALQVQQKLEAVLPPKAGFAAAPITRALQDQIQQRLAKRMATPEFQQAWITANRVAHQQIVRILRGDTPNLVVEDGYVRLTLWPLIGVALGQLQEAGVIPAGVTLPDVSNGLAPGTEAAIENVLGVTLPADFGTVKLMPADKLLQAQQYVRYFDLLVVALILVTVLLIAVTVWYAPRRRWMGVYLAIGGATAIILGRYAIQSIGGSIADSFADADTATTVRSVVGQVLGDLYGFTRIVVVLSIVVAVVAYLSGRPAWFVTLADRAGTGTRAAAAGATAAAATRVSARPSNSAIADSAREHRSTLRLAGLAAIAFVIAWATLGLEIALLAVLLVAGLEVALHALGGPRGDTSGGATGTSTAGEPGVSGDPPGSTTAPAGTNP